MSDARDSRKRKAPSSDSNPRGKQIKNNKQASAGGGKKSNWHSAPAWKNSQILPGDSGIWATCDKGREGKCTAELRDLFGSYAEALYAEELAAEEMSSQNGEEGGDGEGGEAMEVDLEDSIRAEVEGIKRPMREPLFQAVRLDVQCVLFFRTRAPVDPVSFVRHICREALDNPGRKRTRFTKRLSPMTLLGKANEEGLEDVAKKVLAPHFHKQPLEARKFAIRPTLRNHNLLKRDAIIQKVASIVGPGHRVDLKNYDDLIVVEAYTSVIGISVVPNDFEELRRYNLAEIYEPSPREQPKKEAVPEEKSAATDDAPEGQTATDDTPKEKPATDDAIEETAAAVEPTIPDSKAEAPDGKPEEPEQSNDAEASVEVSAA